MRGIEFIRSLVVGGLLLVCGGLRLVADAGGILNARLQALILGGSVGKDLVRLELSPIQLLEIAGMVQGIIQRTGRILGGLVGCGLGLGCGRNGLLCGRLIILCSLELCLAGRDVVVHDVIEGGLRGIDCLLGNIDRGLLITERGGLGLTLVNSGLDVVVDILCLLEGTAGGVDRIHEGGQLVLGRGACDLSLVVGICCRGVGGLILLELLLSIIEVLVILGQGVRDGLDEVVLVLGGIEGGFGVLDVLLGGGHSRICGIETCLLGGDGLLGRLELDDRLIEGGLGICRLGLGGILSLGQLLDGGIAPLAEGLEIGVDLAVPIGLLGLHVGLRRIQLGLLLIKCLLGGLELGRRLIELSLKGIEVVCGTVLGSLGIGYLLLEVGHLSLRRIDVPLGLLGGLLGHMDSGLGVGPYLLGGLDLLERACASRLCGLVGCSSLLGSLCSVGSLCGGDIICGLGLGQLLVGCSLGIGRGLYIGLTCLSVGGCLIVCGLGVGLCRLCGIHGGLRGIELLVCLVQLALGEIHGRLGILYGLLGDLLDVGLGG